MITFSPASRVVRTPGQRQPSAPPPQRNAVTPDSLLVGPRAAAATKLGAQETLAFQSLWSKLDATGRARLERLRDSGKLAVPDSRGITLLTNLVTLSVLQPPEGAPYNAVSALTQTLMHVDDPGVINQSNRNTCAAAIAQYVLANTQPAEYVRLVAGILGQGRVALQGGEPLVRVQDSLKTDTSNRDDVERLMQSALQDFGPDPRGRYSNVADDFLRRQVDGRWTGAFGRLANRVVTGLDAGKGIGERKAARMFEQALGQKMRVIGDMPGIDLLAPLAMRRDVPDRVLASVRAGRPAFADIVLAGLQDEPGKQVESPIDQAKLDYAVLLRSHQVLVTKAENGRVYYRNPWGYETSLSEREFRSRVTDAVLINK